MPKNLLNTTTTPATPFTEKAKTNITPFTEIAKLAPRCDDFVSPSDYLEP
jgi:hypothetical protein